jgi:hypothetical protein
MKMKNQIFTILLLCFCFFSKAVQSQSDTSFTLTFTGSAGYILESGDTKIVIDAIFDDLVRGFGSEYPRPEMYDAMKNGDEPFNNIDLMLFTHIHPGHFDSAYAAACLKNNPNALLVGTDSIIYRLQRYDTLNQYSNQLYVPEINAYGKINDTLADIPFEFSLSPHWGDTQLLHYMFTMKGIRFAFYIGYEKAFFGHYVTTDDIDFGFMDQSFFFNDLEMFNNDFDVKHASVTHVSSLSSNRYELQNQLNTISTTTELDYMYGAMQKVRYTLIEGSFIADTLNAAPLMTTSFEKLTIPVGEEFEYSISDSMIMDDNSDLRIEIDTELPQWLSFDTAKNRLFGTPQSEQTLSIQIAYIDPHFAWVKGTLDIEVQQSTSVDLNNSSRINVFPNQAHSSIHTVNDNKQLINELK